jgi:hypothetical protein
MKAKLPATLTVEMTCLYPRWICSVSDNIGTANGGFWKGFRTHADMWTWLDRHSYKSELAIVARV